MRLAVGIALVVAASGVRAASNLTLFVSAVDGDDGFDGLSPKPSGGGHGPWKTLARAQQGVREHLLGSSRTDSASGSPAANAPATLTVSVAPGASYVLNRTLIMTSEDSPSASSGFDRVVWAGQSAWEGSSPCAKRREPGNFSAACQELTAADVAVVSGGSQISGWEAVTVEQARAAVAGMAPGAPALDASTGLVAAAAAKHLYLGKTADGFSSPTSLYDQYGNSRIRARSPPGLEGDYFVWSSPLCQPARAPKCAEQDRWGFVYPEGSVLDSYVDPGRTRFVVYHGWTDSSHGLRSVVTSNRSVLFTNPAGRPIGFWPNKDSEGGGRFFTESVESLSLTGRELGYGAWAWSEALGGVLYVPQVGESEPPPSGWAVSRLQQAVNVSAGSHDIELRGLSFRALAWDCDSAGGEVCDHQSTDWQAHAAVQVGGGASRIAVTSSEVVGSGSYALWADVGTHNVTFQRNYLRELGSGGIRIGRSGADRNTSRALGTVATSNVVRRGGLDFASGTGVLVQFAEHCSVVNNEVGYLAYTGISVGWSWNFAQPSGTESITVGSNYIHHLGAGRWRQLGDAMAGVYTLGVQPGTRISGNFIHDVFAFYTGGYGVSHDQGSSDLVVEGNVVFRVNAALVTQHYGERNLFRNNYFVDGYVDSATDENSPAIRTVPGDEFPNSWVHEKNVYSWSNSSNDALTFNGDFFISSPGPAMWNCTFARNVYWDSGDRGLQDRAVWGGCVRECKGHQPYKMTWEQWTGGCGTSNGSTPTSCTGFKQDEGSLFADPGFHDPEAFDFSWDSTTSPLAKLGIAPISLASVGIV